MSEKATITLIDLSWEDIVFTNIFSRISLLDCFNLRRTSNDFEKIVDHYFLTIRCVRLIDAQSLNTADLTLLATKTKNLKKVNFERCKINSECVKLLIVNNLCLTHINLSYTSLKDTALHGLIYCPNLRQLILQGCSWVTNECLLTLRFHLKQLEYLNLTHCPQLDGHSMVTPLSTDSWMKHLALSPGEDFRQNGCLWDKKIGGFLIWGDINRISVPNVDSEGWLVDKKKS